MRCPYCKEQKDKVIDSRATEGGAVIRRRRKCLACKRRYTSYERVESTNKLLVIKKDGNRQPYEREKLVRSVQSACFKLPHSAEAIQSLVDEVEEVVFQRYEKEVPSQVLGNEVASRLRRLDKVAYLRFAALYLRFRLVDDFIQEARSILDGEQTDVIGQQELFKDE